MTAVVNLAVLALILGLTYALSSEGLWGSATMCFNVMFSGIIAFNFYEPLAKLMATNLSFLSYHADLFCLMILFIACVWILRLTTESFAPALIRYPSIVAQLGRLFFGFAGAVMTVAILLLAFHTASVDKKVFGQMDYKFRPPFGFGVDHEWLAFFQWTTGAVFPDLRDRGRRDPEYPNAKMFDPAGKWLLDHQQARPFGTADVLSTDDDAAAPADSGASGSGEKGADAGGGSKPGDPTVVGSGATGVVIPGNN